ncbi:hypothetical protein OH76DRAFT_1411435 [Lentinus brumalis]|uniref:Uncharacterized protein n=1 Tax=Lentinus brumalis TaxID=2498619 RepID=A0A371CPI1_9APHY|nr:hypothetical protein OH76DRAFT_1411435 [Polyporus brumalis]
MSTASDAAKCRPGCVLSWLLGAQQDDFGRQRKNSPSGYYGLSVLLAWVVGVSMRS